MVLEKCHCNPFQDHVLSGYWKLSVQYSLQTLAVRIMYEIIIDDIRSIRV